MPVDRPHTPANGDEAGAVAGRLELLCLLRLHEIALANPPPVEGLRAMVDEIVRLPSTFRAVVAVPSEGRLRYVAHVGVPDVKPHEPLVRQPTPMVVRAMNSGELVQLTRSEGVTAHGCVNLPIKGSDRALGFLGLGMHVPIPLEPWREESAWAMADLMALLLLKHRSTRSNERAAKSRDLNRLTPRQREVLYELVERGAGNAEIGERFGLSARTIKVHLMAAYRQLGVHSRAEAIRLVLTEHGDWLARERMARRQRSAAS